MSASFESAAMSMVPSFVIGTDVSSICWLRTIARVASRKRGFTVSGIATCRDLFFLLARTAISTASARPEPPS